MTAWLQLWTNLIGPHSFNPQKNVPDAEMRLVHRTVHQQKNPALILCSDVSASRQTVSSNIISAFKPRLVSENALKYMFRIL